MCLPFCGIGPAWVGTRVEFQQGPWCQLRAPRARWPVDGWPNHLRMSSSSWPFWHVKGSCCFPGLCPGLGVSARDLSSQSLSFSIHKMGPQSLLISWLGPRQSRHSVAVGPSFHPQPQITSVGAGTI